MQLPQRLDDHVSMALGVIALEAEQARRNIAEARGKLDERGPRAVVQVLAVDRGAALDVAGPIPIAVRLGVAERPHVDVRNAGLAQRPAQGRLRAAGPSRERQLPNVDDALDAGVGKLRDRLVARAAWYPTVNSMIVMIGTLALPVGTAAIDMT
jgi:hypothetical protein